MKYYINRLLLLGLFLFVMLSTAKATAYTWNGNTSSNWATASNWTPAGVPGASDNVTISTATKPMLLDADRLVANFTCSAASLNLNGHSLSLTGTTLITGGSIANGTLIVTGAATQFG